MAVASINAARSSSNLWGAHVSSPEVSDEDRELLQWYCDACLHVRACTAVAEESRNVARELSTNMSRRRCSTCLDMNSIAYLLCRGQKYMKILAQNCS